MNPTHSDIILSTLLEIWTELLKKPVTPETHFFQVGGDSLLAVAMFSALDKRLGVHLPLTTLVDTPTLEGLAEVVRAARIAGAADLSPFISKPTPDPQPTPAGQHTHTPMTTALLELGLHSLFEKNVLEFGGRPCFMYDGLSVSYQRMNQEANRIANALLSLAKPPAPGEPVALVASYTHLHLAAIFGAFKAGASVAFVDPRSPASHNRKILEQSGARWVLTTAQTLAQANEMATNPTQIIQLESLAGQSPENPGIPHDPDRLAYLIYTSGSTGTPKGVQQTHRTSAHAVLRMVNSMKIGPSDRWLSLAALTHVASVNQILRMTLTGGCFYAFNIYQSGLDGVGELMAREAITIISAVPTVFRRLVEAAHGQLFPPVRYVVLAGEALYGRDVALFRQYFPPGTTLLNNLGCSEYSAYCNYTTGHNNPSLEGLVPVGQPNQDTEVFLVDGERRPLPPGEPGEIAIRSRYLSPGYWREPEQTRQAFSTPDENGHRVFYTGDLGRWSSDGLVHLGRKDLQVKIRGNRVEIGGVEAILSAHPHVQQAMVAAQRDAQGETRLVGFVVPQAGRELNESELYTYASQHLPGYMVPTRFVLLGKLPQNRTSKVDRTALANLDPEQPLPAELSMAALAGEPRATQSPTAAKTNRQAELRLVLLQPGTHPRPIFAIAPHGGSALAFRELGLALHSGRPLYGVETPEAPHNPGSSQYVEQTAQAVLSAIPSIQPDGPYCLLGYSAGGILAYEAAWQCQDAGIPIELVGLVDTFGPGTGHLHLDNLPQKTALYAGLLAGHLRDLAGFRGAERSQYFKQYAGYYRELLQIKLNRWTHRGPVSPKDPVAAAVQNVTGRFWERTGYAPRPYPGKIYLFRARVDPLRDPLLGWAGLALQGLEMVAIPGNHVYLMRKPAVRRLAEAIEQRLETP